VVLFLGKLLSLCKNVLPARLGIGLIFLTKLQFVFIYQFSKLVNIFNQIPEEELLLKEMLVKQE
jgi:hypothetical protein